MTVYSGTDMSVLPLFAYDIVVADFPWPWEAYSAKGHEKSPEAQYATMGWPEIEAARVGDLLKPSGVLWLWATWPLIHRQAALVPRWGLECKTGGVWAKRTASGKLRWGPGYILRSTCEPFLIATLPGHKFKGSSQVNFIETVALIESVANAAIDGLAREHSRKPDEVFSLIDTIMPEHSAKLDLFSRQPRAGWDSFGNEATKFDESAA